MNEEDEVGNDLFLSREQLVDLPVVAPLIDGMINRDSIVWLSGKFGTYKTFVALSWALCVATGRPWNGRKVHAGPVIYVAAEGQRGISKRICAWEKGVNDGAPAADIHVTRSGIDPRNPALMSRLTQKVTKLGAKLVVFDTLHRCTPGFEENSNKEAGEIFGALQRLKDATGCTVLALHRTGHAGERARGAFGMERYSDDAYVISLKGDPEDRSPSNPRVLVRRKSKEGGTGEQLALTLHAAADSVYVHAEPRDVRSHMAREGADADHVEKVARRVAELVHKARATERPRDQ